MTRETDLEAALALLARRGWFSERSRSVQDAMACIARLRRFAAGQALYLFGDEPDGLYGLIEGALEIAIPRADGTEFTVHRAFPGFWIGDLAVFAGQKRLVSVFAAAPTRVIYLPQDKLRRLVRDDPTYYEDFFALNHENMATALHLVGNLSTTPSEARVALRLLQLEESKADGAKSLKLSHAKLAELVALSKPTLQRVLHRLKSAGLIELSYSRIRIVDRGGLLACASQSGSETSPLAPGRVA